MKKNLRKLGALVLALAMVLGMTSMVFAAPAGDMTSEAGVLGEFVNKDTPVVQGDTLTLYKEITAYNEDGKTVNAPTITYNYTITGLAGGKSITDDENGSKNRHNSGVAATVTTKDASALAPTISGTGNGVLAITPANQLAASEKGKANRFELTIDFRGLAWSGAGVYRFQIDETTTLATKKAAGITGNDTETRYIDVYVKDKDGGGYEIYGYTCLSANVNSLVGTDSSSVAAAGKTEGFVGGSKAQGEEYDNESDSTADRYYTFNLTVGKTLVGDSYSNDHDFPFTVKFANTSVTSDIIIKLELSENGAAATADALPTGKLSTASTGITDSARGIDHESTVMYVGVPVGIDAATSAEVYEVNNVTGTTYLSQYSLQGAALTGDKKIDWNTGVTSTSNTATMPAITAGANDKVSHTIQFTNTLELISPTGVALRVAPYVAILCGGIVLLALTKKRKADEEA